MGHLARNANLSVKAILGIAAYGDLCRRRGDDAAAEKYMKIAKQGAEFWMKTAADGNHYRLAFDKAEHLEPEIQSRLGQAAGPQRLPAESGRR